MNEKALTDQVEYAIYDKNKKKLDLSYCKNINIKVYLLVFFIYLIFYFWLVNFCPSTHPSYPIIHLSSRLFIRHQSNGFSWPLWDFFMPGAIVGAQIEKSDRCSCYHRLYSPSGGQCLHTPGFLRLPEPCLS